MNSEECRRLTKEAKLKLLEVHHRNRIGHLGGNLSCLDTLLFLYHEAMTEEDRFVLSKGHAAGALYVTLWQKGLLTDAQLSTFNGEGTRLPGHPSRHSIPSVEFSTGSLGHGLGLAAGCALADKVAGRAGTTYCLTSDGEWQEGSSWEALIFAAHHSLSQLIVLIDANGLQGFGSTRDVAGMDALTDKLRHFDVEIREAPGHDWAALRAATAATGTRPVIAVLDSIKGAGISFMENRLDWHYLPLDDDLYRQARDEVERA